MTRRPQPAARPEAEAGRGPQLALVPIGLLRPNPRNPRQHPESQIERLMASLRRDGQTRPVLVRRDNRMIIAGHGLVEAARRLGLADLSALLWDVDQETADRVMLADNRLGELSSSDGQRVAALLQEIDEADHLAAGFSGEEVAKLLDGFDEQLEVMEINATLVRDDFWVTARGPLAQQAEVLQRIKVLLGEFPAVTVELGTVKGL